MRQIWQIRWMGVILMAGLLATLVWAETLELQTYYPSPPASNVPDPLYVDSAAVGSGLDPTPNPPLSNGVLLVEERMGIGTNNPSAKLDVQGNAHTNFNTLLRLSNPDPNPDDPANDAAGLFFDAQTRDWAIAATNPSSGFGDEKLVIYDNNAGFPAGARMVIDLDGNVGIGTANPTNALSFSGDAARTVWLERHTAANTTGNSLTLQAGGATANAANRGGGDLLFASGIATGTGSSRIFFQTATAGVAGNADRLPATKMTILGNGSVGIGTQIPQAVLDIVSDGGAILVPRKTTAGDPDGGINGMIYYNADSNRFRVHENGGWKNMRGFGPPDYESPWTTISRGSDRTFTHNLGTVNYIVYLEGRSADLGIHNKVSGAGGADGAYFHQKQENSVQAHRISSDDKWGEIRVRCWKF